eukprot:12217652-Alexandrium_andersonii.AAC.1
MSASLVGSEMCIRDSGIIVVVRVVSRVVRAVVRRGVRAIARVVSGCGGICLLYTSDAADDM